jgi:hypothetical protein
MYRNGSTQVTFVLGALLGQNMTLEGLTAFDGSTWANSKALLCATFSLHFGHFLLPF